MGRVSLNTQKTWKVDRIVNNANISILRSMSLSRLLALFGHRDQKGLKSYLRDCNILIITYFRFLLRVPIFISVVCVNKG